MKVSGAICKTRGDKKRPNGPAGKGMHMAAKRRLSREREEKREQKRMQEVSAKLDALAKRLGRWDAQAIIRKFRDTNLKGDS